MIRSLIDGGLQIKNFKIGYYFNKLGRGKGGFQNYDFDRF